MELFHGLLPVGGFHHPVHVEFKGFGELVPYARVVFRQEDGAFSDNFHIFFFHKMDFITIFS